QPGAFRQRRRRPHPGMQRHEGSGRHDPDGHGRRESRTDFLKAGSMAIVQGHDFPDHLYYDVENQIWYEPLPDGTLRAGFTSWAVALMGEVLVFTPKRLNHTFDRDKWFAMVEGAKWVGAARAAFDGTIVAHNEALLAKPDLRLEDAFGQAWMLIVRPATANWKDDLVTGADVGSAIESWIAGGSYKDRKS